MADSYLHRFLSIFSAKLTQYILTIVSTPIIVRLLGSDGFGDFSFLLSILSVVMIIINAGVFDGIRKFLAEDPNDTEWTTHVFGFYFLLGILLAVLASGSILLLVEAGTIDKFLDDRFVSYFYVLAVIVIGRQMFTIIRGALMGLGKEKYSESLFLTRETVSIVLGVTLAAIGWDVLGLLVGNALAYALGFVVSILVLQKHIRLEPSLLTFSDDLAVSPLFRFVYENAANAFLMTSLYHVDVLLLHQISGSAVTGYYKAALLVVQFTWFIPITLQMFLLQSSSELWAGDKNNKITALSSRISRYTVALTTLMCIGLIALNEEFLLLYFGPAFTQADVAVLLLLPGTLGFAVARPIFAISQGKGELRPLVGATGISALLNLCLNVVLIPHFGMIGAAVATTIGYGSMFLFHAFVARTLGFDPLQDLRVKRLLVVAFVTAPPIFWFESQIASPVVSLLVVPVVGVLIYGTLAIKTGLLDQEEILKIIEKFPAPIADYLDVVS